MNDKQLPSPEKQRSLSTNRVPGELTPYYEELAMREAVAFHFIFEEITRHYSAHDRPTLSARLQQTISPPAE